LGPLGGMLIAFTCSATATAGSPGNAAAGEVLFKARCEKCHTPLSLAWRGDRLRNDLRRINERMSVVGLLWDAEVADLKAFLDSLDPAEWQAR